MSKKSGIALPEVKKWLARLEYAERMRNEADETFGYSRSLKEYAGDYTSTLPSFLADTAVVPINEVYGFAKTFIPSVYSRNPHTSFNPQGAKSIGPCKLLEAGVSAYWRELRLKRQVRRAIFDAIFAEGWFKTGYSGGKSLGSIAPEDGEPPLEANEFVRNDEIFSTRVSWRHMVRDPDAVDGIHDARFVAQKIIKPMSVITGGDFYTAKNINPTHTSDPNFPMGQSRQLPGGEREEFLELWEVWDMDTAKVLWLSAGCDEYLRDPRKWPNDFNGYPFDLLRFNQLEDHAYAPNLIGAWEPQLWEKIKIRSMQMDHIKRFNRQLWAEKGTVTKAELAKFALGKTGAINFYEGKTPPIPAQYPQIQTDIYAIENRVDMDKDNISGQPNAVRGAQQKTASRTLGEVNSVVGAFQARQIDPQSDVEEFCSEIATKIAGTMQKYLSGEKFVRVTNEDLPVLIAAFGRERYDGTGFRFTKADIAGAEFEANVETGSTIPLDRHGRTDALFTALKFGPAIGLVPGDKTSKVIGKSLMSEFGMKEVEIAFGQQIAEMETQKKLMQASMRLQQGALEEKIAKAKGMVNDGAMEGA